MKKVCAWAVCIGITILAVGCAETPQSSSSISQNSSTYPSSSSVSSASSSSRSNSFTREMESVLTVKEQNYFTFTNWPNGTIQKTLQVGDTFLGLRLEKLSVMEYNPKYGPGDFKANFSGTVTLKGTLSFPEEVMYQDSSFIVAEESKGLLPYGITDTRFLWFSVNNRKEIEKILGMKNFEDLECEITIQDYKIICWATEASNSATILSITVL